MNRYDNQDGSRDTERPTPENNAYRRPRIIDPRELDRRQNREAMTQRGRSQEQSHAQTPESVRHIQGQRSMSDESHRTSSRNSPSYERQVQNAPRSVESSSHRQPAQQEYEESSYRQRRMSSQSQQQRSYDEENPAQARQEYSRRRTRNVSDQQQSLRGQYAYQQRHERARSGYDQAPPQSRTPHLSDMQVASQRQQRKNRLPLILAIIAIVVVLASAIGIAFALTSNNQSASSSSTNQPNDARESKVVVNDVPQDSESSSSAKSKSSTTKQEASSERDASFAVDPNNKDWSFKTNGHKTIYLTIDDGPSKNTQPVLDILDRYGAKATFFVVGYNDEYFPMIAEAYKRGHTIGLHSMTHDYPSIYASQQAFFDDLDAIGSIVSDQIGYVPAFIRFPGGSSNMISASYTPGIMTALTAEVQNRGYQYYDWTISFGDGADHSADELVEYACQPPVDENIMMLLHDSTAKDTTVEALPRVIEYYQDLGYSFEAISRESWVCHHGVSN